MSDKKIHYNITAFKDHNGVFVTDSISEQVYKLAEVRNDFIEKLYFEQFSDEQLESLLLYTLEEMQNRVDKDGK